MIEAYQVERWPASHRGRAPLPARMWGWVIPALGAFGVCSAAIMASAPSSKQRPRWRVVRAEFEQSAAESRQCPEAGVPELAIAGRSNVGKSSLLNALSGRNGLARVSRTPGRTRLLNFFHLELLGPARRPTSDATEGQRDAQEIRVPLRIVDLPGYGFAKAARSVRDSFGPMIENYLATRNTLRSIMVLIDARRGPGDHDLELLEWATMSNIPCMICVTKTDKLGASERGLLPAKFGQELNIPKGRVLLTSTLENRGVLDMGKGPSLVAQLGRFAAMWNGEDGNESSGRDGG